MPSTAEPGGRAVVVTGAGGGIGSSIALHLARAGYRVVAADISAEGLAALEGRADGLGIEAVSADTSEEADVHGLFERAQDGSGKLHGAVLCAGLTRRRSLTETTLEEFGELVRANLQGTFLGLREAGRRLEAGGAGGSIVAVTSINAFRALPSQAVYSAAKAAIQSLVASAAVELGPSGTRVNALAPGAVLTPMNPGLDAGDPLRERIPARRIGLPEDLDGAAEFLLGDQSRYITGTSLVVDGGMMAYR
ncbi:SDR family NAD(P)-dependent oxidoreductase [Sinomonas susongensis]|uniref:SDR family NAD(P)-dependent oxidoreductase n=1 Tax=Sinomonas susongensis TaxID=1324851 RepID=UPI0011099E49|nr:SDR family oxidoreductase [Sinomonas susongensis]